MFLTKCLDVRIICYTFDHQINETDMKTPKVTPTTISIFSFVRDGKTIFGRVINSVHGTKRSFFDEDGSKLDRGVSEPMPGEKETVIFSRA